jgi:hypothetical protein
MTDYASTAETAPLPPAPGVIGPGFQLKPGLEFVKEMKRFGVPYTKALGGSSEARPTSGLIFPR